MTKNIGLAVITGLLCCACTGLADDIHGINIDFVNIGGAGNIANSDGYGSVAYNYGISRSEVTIAQFQLFRILSGIGSGNEDYWVGVGPTAPAGMVNWHEAARFCNYLTSGDADIGAYSISNELVIAVDRDTAVEAYDKVYVLPTEDEWYKAAYYKPVDDGTYALYATGFEPTAGVHAKFDSSTNLVWEVGSAVTEEQNGTVDMMGNVWEWTESAYDGTLDNIGEDIAFRGGAYGTSLSTLDSTSRFSDDPDLDHQAIGMRVAVIPEPGTISLMSLSTLGLFLSRSIRRRRLTGRSLLPVGREHLCDTYCTYDEWAAAAHNESEEPDALSVTAELVMITIAKMWSRANAAYKAADRRFWDYMVVSYESRKVRRKAFKVAVKKRALDTLDAFLASIMK